MKIHTEEEYHTSYFKRKNIEMEKFKTQKSYSKGGQKANKHKTASQYANNWN